MSRPDVAIIDGGGANIASLQYALERLGAVSTLTSDASAIRSASHVILPGVGAARAAMDRLRAASLTAIFDDLAQPVLGICLGMQLLAAGSDEDETDCIGVFPERATRLDAAPDAPVPNMGWCRIGIVEPHPLLDDIPDGSWFYFVHSYALPPSGNTLATAEHSKSFAAIVAEGNYLATQFHPERSAAAGARLLANFLRLGT